MPNRTPDSSFPMKWMSPLHRLRYILPPPVYYGPNLKPPVQTPPCRPNKKTSAQKIEDLADSNFSSSSKSKIICNKWNGTGKNRQLVSLKNSVDRGKVYGIRIASAQDIVHAQGPGRMGQLSYFMAAFNIDREIDPEIIGNPIGIAAGIKYPVRAPVFKLCNR